MKVPLLVHEKKHVNSLQARPNQSYKRTSYIFFGIVQVKRVFGFLFTVRGSLFFSAKRCLRPTGTT